MAASSTHRVALSLTGGGARAAYQVGLLRCLGRHAPSVRFPILTGVSAGAINTAFLAQHPGSPSEAAAALTDLWAGLDTRDIFRVDTWSLARNVLRWGLTLVSGGGPGRPSVRGFVDTSPLRRVLERNLPTNGEGTIHGIEANLADGDLTSVALTALKYSTGQTVTWVQGSDMIGWERPNRLGIHARLTVDHVMASAALPLLFPAARVGDQWYGDGGVRLATPLAPAVHLGADRILAISTRYPRTAREAAEQSTSAYPPPAQVVGTLLNAVFLDAVDQDALRLQRINRLLDRCGDPTAEDLRPIELLVLRPSVDLGRLAADYEVQLPRGFRFLTRGLGTRETRSPDFLSLLLFDNDYLTRLIEIGEADAEARLDEILALLDG